MYMQLVQGTHEFIKHGEKGTIKQIDRHIDGRPLETTAILTSFEWALVRQIMEKAQDEAAQENWTSCVSRATAFGVEIVCQWKLF